MRPCLDIGTRSRWREKIYTHSNTPPILTIKIKSFSTSPRWVPTRSVSRAKHVSCPFESYLSVNPPSFELMDASRSPPGWSIVEKVYNCLLGLGQGLGLVGWDIGITSVRCAHNADGSATSSLCINASCAFVPVMARGGTLVEHPLLSSQMAVVGIVSWD